MFWCQGIDLFLQPLQRAISLVPEELPRATEVMLEEITRYCVKSLIRMTGHTDGRFFLRSRVEAL